MLVKGDLVSEAALVGLVPVRKSLLQELISFPLADNDTCYTSPFTKGFNFLMIQKLKLYFIFIDKTPFCFSIYATETNKLPNNSGGFHAALK